MSQYLLEKLYYAQSDVILTPCVFKAVVHALIKCLLSVCEEG